MTIYPITSSLHSETMHKACTDQFIKDLEKALGEKISIGESNIIYVRTGGTEGIFKNLEIKGEIKLLTSGESNSLAASMEILSYLRKQDRKGEIIHGTPEEISAKLKGVENKEAKCGFIKELSGIDLGGIRLGVVGQPSDWLISSDVDYKKAKTNLNANLIDIPMKELLEEIHKHNVDTRSFEGSLAIYEALKTIIARYNLQGLTLRCFDLLDTVHNTGCLALAKLNDEGIPASCEGDIPALLSMAYLQQKTGCPGFQCNLSRISGDELLFAHCTIPFKMLDSYKYTTHFESGIGTAIKGEVKLGKAKIFKISPDLEHCVEIPCEIIKNESKQNLCRTQIIVKAAKASDYFLHEPLANHHIISFE